MFLNFEERKQSSINIVEYIKLYKTRDLSAINIVEYMHLYRTRDLSDAEPTFTHMAIAELYRNGYVRINILFIKKLLVHN